MDPEATGLDPEELIEYLDYRLRSFEALVDASPTAERQELIHGLMYALAGLLVGGMDIAATQLANGIWTAEQVSKFLKATTLRADEFVAYTRGKVLERGRWN